MASWGHMTVTEWRDAETGAQKLWIDQADVDILITPELLDALAERGWAGEGLFKVDAENATAVYRLISPEPDNCWAARLTDYTYKDTKMIWT